MRRALYLAQKGKFTCSPNPMVGCVIVKGSQIIGEGFHVFAGGDHAEVEALKAAGPKARDATLFVTLEPCCHTGRTPPCTEALLRNRIKKVVIATLDPNPKVCGRSISFLKEAGIEVHVGLLESEAQEINKYYFHCMQKKSPYVIAKWAMSLDGKIALQNSEKQFLTSQKANNFAHKKRHEVDAILVGSSTVIQDNPLLSARFNQEQKQPTRIILDRRGLSPINSSVFSNQEANPTIVFTTKTSKKSWRDQLHAQHVKVHIFDTDFEKEQLKFVLKKLVKDNINSLLVEGGSRVLGSFLSHNLVNEAQVYLAPKMLPSETALPASQSNFQDHFLQEWNLKKVEQIGPDVFVNAVNLNV